MSDIEKPHPVLQTAWRLYAQLDANSVRERDQHYLLRKWIAILGVIATLLAIIVDNYATEAPYWADLSLRILLILVPLISSIFAAFSNRFQIGYKFLSYRAAAEDVLKEIYFYRTIMQTMPYRYKWLNNRLAYIQRKLHRSVRGDMVLKPYVGDIPPNYDPGREWSDPGFEDLTGEQYFTYRLEDQLAWHIKRNNQLQRQRKFLQWAILAMGAFGALLAGLNGVIEGLAVWVALTASITTALVGWEELRKLDTVVSNYSRLIVELTIIRDNWLSLETDERIRPAFYRMVQATEKLLWVQNVEYIHTLRESQREFLDDEENMIDEMIRMSEQAAEDSQVRLQEEFEISSQTAVDDSAVVVGEIYSQTHESSWDGDHEPPETVYDDEAFLKVKEAEAETTTPETRSLVASTGNSVAGIKEDIAEIAESIADIAVEEGGEDADDPLRSAIESKVEAAMSEAKLARQMRQEPDEAQPDEKHEVSDGLIAQALEAAQKAAEKFVQDAKQDVDENSNEDE
jgi:hypothetical protein